jgi:predicted double-glycine peptidase
MSPRKKIRSGLVAAAAAVATVALLGPASAASVPVVVAGERLNVGVTSWKSRTYRTVFLQQYDFSCGSAALASLLTFHYDHPILEAQVFQAMYRAGNQKLIRQQGFSLLDMKNFLARLGYSADGFAVTLEKMEQIGVPFITLLQTRGYKQFVVVKGIRKDRVLLGDPARGVVTQSREDFEQSWDHVAFLIRGKAQEARASFNDAEDWAIHPRAPIHDSALLPQALGSFALQTRPLF